MRTIIAGSRNLRYEDVDRALGSFCPWVDQITEVVSGRAPRGVDRHGERWAKERGIPVRPFPAQWDVLGRRAGFVRNLEMADYADALVAVWDGSSRGTRHMIETARKKGLTVAVHLVDAKLPVGWVG